MGVWPPGARTPAQGGSVKAGPCGGGVGQSSCRSHVGRTGRGEWSEAARPQRGFIPQVVGNGKKQWVKGQEATAVPGAGKWGEKNKGDPQTTDGIVGISQSPGHSLRTPPPPEGTLVLPIPWAAFCPSPWPQVFPPQPPPKATLAFQ